MVEYTSLPDEEEQEEEQEEEHADTSVHIDRLPLQNIAIPSSKMQQSSHL